MGLFKKDKEKKPPKADGSDKSWGQIIRDMPRMPTTHDMAQGTANAASFMKNLANQGDVGRLRSTGLKGTATLQKFRDTGGRAGMNPVVERELMVHVEGSQDWAVTHQESMAPFVFNALKPGKQMVCFVNPDDQTEMVLNM